MKIFKNKKVFVSGGNGVIGNSLVRKLQEAGAIIFVGDLKHRPTHWDASIYYRQGDLNLIGKEELEDFSPDYFFHLAATFERSTESYSFWDENFEHNVKLSNHLMTCLKDCSSLKKVIFASSYLIYDPVLYQFKQPTSIPYSLKETDQIYPRNLTGVAKLAHEIELRFINQFKKQQYKIVSARIYRGHGLNSRDIISRWIRSLINNERLTVYRKEGMFDYIFSEDSAEGLLRLAESDAAEGIINLGTGKARKVSEVLDILKTEFPEMTYEENEAEADIPYEASQADIKLLKNLTGWAPEFSLEKSVKAIVDFEKQRDGIYDDGLLPQVNILVTSISRKVPLLNCVKIALNKLGENNMLFGGDSDTDAIGQYFVDHFWKMPALTGDCINEIIFYCKEHSIKGIIPTRDGELNFWAMHKDLLLANDIRVMVSHPDTVENCLDKLTFYQKLKDHNLPVINTTADIDELPDDGEYVVKERHGAGSHNLGIKLRKEEAITLATKLKNPIFQPYIQGKEYSIDAYITENNTVKGIVVRSRDKVISGESQITTIENKPLLKKLCEDIIAVLQLKGHIVLQVFEDNRGHIYMIECNSRFGGASTLSIAAGLDSFYWFFLEILNVDLLSYTFRKAKPGLKQIRFASDKVVFTDNTL